MYTRPNKDDGVGLWRGGREVDCCWGVGKGGLLLLAAMVMRGGPRPSTLRRALHFLFNWTESLCASISENEFTRLYSSPLLFSCHHCRMFFPPVSNYAYVIVSTWSMWDSNFRHRHNVTIWDIQPWRYWTCLTNSKHVSRWRYKFTRWCIPSSQAKQVLEMEIHIEVCAFAPHNHNITCEGTRAGLERKFILHSWKV
jgi:hypothetical protein